VYLRALLVDLHVTEWDFFRSGTLTERKEPNQPYYYQVGTYSSVAAKPKPELRQPKTKLPTFQPSKPFCGTLQLGTLPDVTEVMVAGERLWGEPRDVGTLLGFLHPNFTAETCSPSPSVSAAGHEVIHHDAQSSISRSQSLDSLVYIDSESDDHNPTQPAHVAVSATGRKFRLPAAAQSCLSIFICATPTGSALSAHARCENQLQPAVAILGTCAVTWTKT
jgi:hypothetical protein